jgi:hypothetical protein
MNFSYGRGNKVYGKDISEARYNALLETFYKFYPELQRKIKLGKNYFERDPKTAQLLERRVLGEDVYIPDEDKEILKDLSNAYKSTKIDLETCINQKDQTSCQNLKFKGLKRCSYEKKWLSFIRGGNCFISEDVINHIISNLQSVVNINWNPFSIVPRSVSDGDLPNPDEFTKIDMINIIHDLGYHVKTVFNQKDLVTVLEEKHGKKINVFSDQEILYYVYLFSFIVYISQFLKTADFKKFLNSNNQIRLQQMLNNTPSKRNLIAFMVEFSRALPPTERISSGWAFAIVVGTLLALLVIGFLPAATALYNYSGRSQNRTSIIEQKYNTGVQELQKYPVLGTRAVYEEKDLMAPDKIRVILRLSDQRNICPSAAGLMLVNEDCNFIPIINPKSKGYFNMYTSEGFVSVCSDGNFCMKNDITKDIASFTIKDRTLHLAMEHYIDAPLSIDGDKIVFSRELKTPVIIDDLGTDIDVTREEFTQEIMDAAQAIGRLMHGDDEYDYKSNK